MAQSNSASGSFNPDQLDMLAAVYEAVCTRLKQDGVELTSQVRDTIRTAIFKQARKGVRDPDRLWSRALREVEAFNGVQRTLFKMASRRRA